MRGYSSCKRGCKTTCIAEHVAANAAHLLRSSCKAFIQWLTVQSCLCNSLWRTLIIIIIIILPIQYGGHCGISYKGSYVVRCYHMQLSHMLLSLVTLCMQLAGTLVKQLTGPAVASNPRGVMHAGYLWIINPWHGCFTTAHILLHFAQNSAIIAQRVSTLFDDEIETEVHISSHACVLPLEQHPVAT
ncbi:hypothetical protein COO60DRAFT_74195 [Scenedesmus sp. NREL 46B-D3]|nr:hypothetical protein COO60DRAFT_74195 [Scenedesmus sp. NREL 46B-D3]